LINIAPLKPVVISSLVVWIRAQIREIPATRGNVLYSAITKSGEAVPSQSRKQQEQIRKHASQIVGSCGPPSSAMMLGIVMCPTTKTVSSLSRRKALAVA
jgi:hypothetical protein